MGVWIDIEKVKSGFEYKIGRLVVARSRWVKKDGEWKLKLMHLQFNPEDKFATKAVAEFGPFTPTEVMEYLQDQTTKEIT